MNEFALEIIDAALAESRKRAIPIHTFALYYDHESPAISICIDTAKKSAIAVKKENAYQRKYFLRALAEGSLKEAATWPANIGRSLSLGDFAFVNMQRRELPTKRHGTKFFLGLVQALVTREKLVAKQCLDKSQLVLCCTGPNSEIEYVWSI